MDEEILPALTPFNRVWFTSGTLAVQHCPRCDVLQHPPEELCHVCGEFDLAIRVLAPKGSVLSFTVVHHPPSPRLADRVPYTVVLVALEDDSAFRVVGDLLGDDPHDVHIGMLVVAEWTEHEGDGEVIRLPHWRRAEVRS